MSPETIVRAAIRYRDVGVVSVPAPGRHHHVIMIRHIIDGHETRAHEIQGFITSLGRFVDRKRGAKIALRAGQATTLRTPDILYSEDLW